MLNFIREEDKMYRISIYSIALIGVFITTLYVSSKAYAQSAESDRINSIDYFYKRSEAIEFAQSGKWNEVLPLLENLTMQYQNDCDLFYLLGLSYYQTARYQKSVAALKNTLACGGTILSNIPAASPPSNDIMIQIARAYALDGDKANAMAWLQKGFAARYDEKPFLKGDPAFEAFNEDRDFLNLFGYSDEEALSREEEWRCDINYLKARILELHYNPYHNIAKTDLLNQIEQINAIAGSLSDEQIVVELMKVIGSLGNGHNLIIPTSPNKGALKKLPVQFYQFSDGLFIVDAEEDYQQWIGYEVESIGNTNTAVALQNTNAVNAKDNEMQTLWLGPYYLGLPAVLKGLEIVENTDQVTLTLKDKNEVSQQVTMNPIDWSFAGFPKMPQLKKETQPMSLSKMNDPYWYQFMQDDNILYIQFNTVTNKEDQSLEDFTREVRKQMAQNKTQHLILDLRHNQGGDGSLLPPLLKMINSFDVMNPTGKIFVLMGRETFSAGQNLLTEITKNVDPILVGEPSGSKPNHIGEAGWFQLPYSGLMGLISTQFHQTSKAEDHRKWIAPHIPVSVSSTDYFNGSDRALEIIMEVTETTEK
jgi:hypothetical protein